MATSDLRDVLELPTEGVIAPRPSKKGKPFGHRQSLKGLAREVQSLGGDTPIAIVQQQLAFKKKRFASRKPAAKWEMRPFTNSARSDGSLTLRHWRRKDAVALGPNGEEVPVDQPEESAFAKFNVKVQLPHYTDEQYHAYLENEDWSREETDYLIRLAADYDLRWPIMWDRYDYTPTAIDGIVTMNGDESKAMVPVAKPRSMEDMKARLYQIQAKMMEVQKPPEYMTVSEMNLYETLTNFNPNSERLRKEFATNTLSRSREEAREEELLLVEIKRVLARNERFNEERRELYQRLDYPKADTHDISSIRTSTGLQNLLQTLYVQDKSKKRKSIVGPEAVGSSVSGAPTAAAAAAATAPAIASSSSSSSAAAAAAAAETPMVEAAIKRRESVTSTSATPAPPQPLAPITTTGHNRRDSITVQTPTAAAKKGAHPLQERQKLSEQEMAVYGVSHHDRLTSGASFRTERTNKLFASKSNSQQQRITNVLLELDVPPRLVMPTAGVSASFEKLLHTVNGLLDCRKISDKLDAELKLELAKKAERERLEREKREREGGGVGREITKETAKEIVDKEGEGAVASVEVDEGGKGEEREGRRESVEEEGNHKRSASVLSAASDKSSKRQKK